MQPSVGLPPPLQNAANPPVAKRRRDGANATDFPYWSINLAKLLTRRRVATMSPPPPLAFTPPRHPPPARPRARVRRPRADGQKRRQRPIRTAPPTSPTRSVSHP